MNLAVGIFDDDIVSVPVDPIAGLNEVAICLGHIPEIILIVENGPDHPIVINTLIRGKHYE